MLRVQIRRQGASIVGKRLGWSKSKMSRYRGDDWKEMYEGTRDQLIDYLRESGVLPPDFQYGDTLPQNLQELVRREREAWNPRRDQQSRAKTLVERLAKKYSDGTDFPTILRDGYGTAAALKFTAEEFAEIDAWRDDELEGLI